MGAKKLNLTDLEDSFPKATVEAVEETIKTFLNIDVEVDSIKYDAQYEYEHSREISGVVGFVKERLEGTLALSFDKETIFKILENFYGTPVDSIGDETIDGVAELANIIHAIIKERLSQCGYQLQMCLPFVVVGSHHQIFSTACARRILVTFDSKYGKFSTEITIFQEKPAKQ